MRAHLVYRRFPASVRVEITPEVEQLARSRTEHLHRHIEAPITELLASAYLQGVNDTVQVIERRGWTPAEEGA